MSGKTSIEWTDKSWNPVTGCTKVSPGCKRCYAEAIARRFGRDFSKIELRRDRLATPYKWDDPCMIFVNSASDLFHEKVPFEFIAEVCTTMGQCPQHTFQVLTKRPERMLEFFDWNYPLYTVNREAAANDWLSWMPNVWWGTSVENQEQADKRIPHLLKVPAAVRFLSCEPLLGHIDISARFGTGICAKCNITTHVQEASCCRCRCALTGGSAKRWVIVGGESGPGARPCNLAWLIDLRDRCRTAGVPFFLKQLGNVVHCPYYEDDDSLREWVLSHNRVRTKVPGRNGYVDWEEDIDGQPPSNAVLELRLPHKGGRIDDWHESLRIRQWPKIFTEHAMCGKKPRSNFLECFADA